LPHGFVLAALLSSGLVCSGAFAQSPQGDGNAAAAPATGNSAPAGKAAATGKAAAAGARLHYQPNRFSGRAGTYYRVIWGVDSLAVRWTESGEIIRFTYRVLDPDKAKPLNEKKSEPSLIAPTAHVKLVVPSLENVGQLRQSTDPEEGKVYWMAFSNKGRLVKRGDRVSVVIGGFRADGLVVD